MLYQFLHRELAVLVTLLSLSSAASVSYNASLLQKCSAGMDGTLPSITPPDFEYSGTVRRYYIAAEEVTWDYVPSGWDNWLGVPISASPRAALGGFTAPGSLGTKWQKAMYRGYTDATFSTLTPQPVTQGINGPTIRAEVSDMIEILFINNLAENYVSMHSMGLSYTKGNEGSLYPNYTSSGNSSQVSPVGNAVPPGGCYVYKWLVNNGSAPTQGESSHMWGYHSYVSMSEDINAGLVGPTIIYARDMMSRTMAQNREFVLLYMNHNEAKSTLAATNAKAFGVAPQTGASSIEPLPSLGQNYGNYSIWHPQITTILSATNQLNTTQAPTFFTLNGFVFANNAPFEMCLGDKVIWYVYAFGSSSHVFHMHGNGFVFLGQNLASISLNDGIMRTLRMTANGQGDWQLICHVSDHLSFGMQDKYVVYPSGQCSLPALE